MLLAYNKTTTTLFYEKRKTSFVKPRSALWKKCISTTLVNKQQVSF